MPGPKGYFETVSVSDEPAPPGAHDVITYTTLTTDVSVVGRANDYSVKVGTMEQVPIAGDETTWRPEAAVDAVAVTVAAGSPTGAGAGANITITAGTSSGSNGGGNASFLASSASGGNNAGGSVTIYSGAGAGTQAGGAIFVVSGQGGATGVGGALSLAAGTGGGAGGAGGGSITLDGGSGGAAGNGGAVTISGGIPTAGNGGTVTIGASAGVGTNKSGGGLNLNAGASTGNQDGGLVAINGGAGGTGGTGNGGAVAVTGGLSATGATGNGGAVTIAGGAATSTDGSGGAVTISGGVGTGTGLRGTINFTGSLTLNTNEVTLNSNQNDYTGGDGYGVLKINATGNFDLTGLANPVSGRQLIIYNTGASTITLKHDATSAAANRFYLPGAADLAIGQYRGVLLEYAPTVARWIVVGMSAASGGTAGLANVAYVSKAGDDATAELNNEAKPYLTIAAAITAAAADIALGAGPYTIQLGTGTWTENLTWAEQLSLRGLGNRVSIVSGTLTLTAGATAVANELNFSDVRITGDVALNFNAKTAGTSAVYCNACYFGDSFSMNKRSGGTDELRMDASTVVDRLTSTEVAAVRLFDSAIDDLRIAQSGGSERSTVVGCCGSILVLSGSAGTVSMTACQYRDGSLSIAVAALETSGCDFKGSSVTITAGTWIQNGCTFSNSGYLASAAPGTVDLTYWGGVVNVTAAATLTLPATARKGYVITVKNGNSVASGNNVTIARNGNSIEGSAADYVIGPLSSVTLMGDGTNWWIIS